VGEDYNNHCPYRRKEKNIKTTTAIRTVGRTGGDLSATPRRRRGTCPGNIRVSSYDHTNKEVEKQSGRTLDSLKVKIAGVFIKLKAEKCNQRRGRILSG